MKHFKKFFSYLVALTMVLSLAAFTGVKVHAEGTTYTLTLKETATGHTYEAYQVFTGDLNKEKNSEGKEVKVLSNVKWGTGVTYNGTESAADVAKDLGDNKMTIDTLISRLTLNKDKATTKESTAGNTEITGLAAGYYLVKDADDSQKDKSDAYTKFIVQVVGDTEAKIKSGVPTVEKKVKDTNDSTGKTSDWQDSADADINDTVEYQITGTMPANIADYTEYKYVFTDTMSKGLTYTANTATIKIGDKDVTKYFTESVTPGDNGTTVTWSRDNLKDISGVTLDENTKVVVTYSAKLNDKAEIGSAGNPNTVYLKYSNNPNYTGKGENSPEGKTPEDKNIVFTYKLDVNKYKDKIDKDHKTDEAVFKLYKEIKGTNGKLDVKNVTLTKADKVYSAVGLDDGVYILQETKAPDGYNKIDGNVTFAGTTYENAREFTVEATHSNSTDTLDPELTSLTGTKKTGEITLTSVKKDNSDKPTGTLTTDVIDKKGSTLPSTGGMGTTLLYVAGGILVACAAAYVVMSRKHSTNK